MLTQAQIHQYREDGFVVPDFRMPRDVVESIRERHRRLLVRHPDFRQYCPALLHFDLDFAECCETPGLLDLVEQLIGPDLALWNMSFFAKPAHDGQATPWHQDGQYWAIRPLATCSVWVAVDDSRRDNGCLRVLPGTHRARRLSRHRTNASPDLTLNQELLPEEIDLRSAVDLVLEAGQISLHDVYLAHGSEPNRSQSPRRGMTMRIMPTTSVYDRALANEMHGERETVNQAHNPLLLLRGVDRSGRNDFTVSA